MTARAQEHLFREQVAGQEEGEASEPSGALCFKEVPTVRFVWVPGHSLRVGASLNFYCGWGCGLLILVQAPAQRRIEGHLVPLTQFQT